VKSRDKIAQEVMHYARRLLRHKSGALPITTGGKYPAMYSSLPPEAHAAMLYILIQILGLHCLQRSPNNGGNHPFLKIIIKHATAKYPLHRPQPKGK
jgi:hypothetical protein